MQVNARHRCCLCGVGGVTAGYKFIARPLLPGNEENFKREA